MSKLNSDLSVHIKKSFSDSDGIAINEFLSRDFSNSGQVTIASLFLYGKEAGKEVQEILTVLEECFNKNWQYQHPDIRGNVDVPIRGAMNQALLCDIHSQLGIPLPEGYEPP
jgi:hypothetical protein